jgi:hypothetical protein
MATVNAEQRFLALRVVLLRIRLLAIRGLLRTVIALRSFIRSRRQRITPAIRSARIRVGPWMSVPMGHRERLLLPVLLVGAACGVTGLMVGSRYERGNWAHSSTPEAVARNVAVKVRDASAEPDLAFKGETDASIEVGETKPATPHVVVLNPGMAEQEGKSLIQATARPSTRPADNDVSRPDFTAKDANDHRPSSRPMKTYRDLRDYMLRR